MRPLPAVADRRWGVFTGGEAAADGWTRSALEHAARRGRAVRLQRGVWADTAVPADLAPAAAADLLRLRCSVAAALSVRGAIVSHLAAATAHDVPTWAPEPRACLTVTGRGRGTFDHVHTHRAAVARAHVRADVASTTLARTIVDITKEFGVEAGLVTADAALHGQWIRAADLAAEIEATRPAPGTRRLADLLRLVDADAESPLESRSRWHLDRCGVDPPRSQVVLRTRGGTRLGRCDFYWEEGVVGEVDGNVKYRRRGDARDPDEERIREKWRQERMERAGLLVVRWGQRDFVDFETVARLIADRRQLARRPGRPRDWVAAPRS